jgi:hypothetical protein
MTAASMMRSAGIAVSFDSRFTNLSQSGAEMPITSQPIRAAWLDPSSSTIARTFPKVARDEPSNRVQRHSGSALRCSAPLR